MRKLFIVSSFSYTTLLPFAFPEDKDWLKDTWAAQSKQNYFE